MLVGSTLTWSEGGFSSLADVKAPFNNRWALLADWTHHLAFDLFVGRWEVRDAQQRGIPHLLIMPALVLTTPSVTELRVDACLGKENAG